VIAYNFFSTRLEQVTIRIEEAANELVSYIHLREQV
jgi:biopolymer transport protein ExbB/TolQ